jgi:hypothetical protein
MFDNVLFPIIICVVVVLFVVIVRLFRNKKNQYDERQLLARNAAYKVSFFFLLIYCSVCGLMQILDVKWADAAVQMFLGIILSFVLFIAVCMIKDAYFSDSPKRNTYSVLFFFGFGILYLIHLMMRLSKGEVLFDNGELTVLVLYLVSSVCFIALGILAVIKIIFEKRGAEK